MKTKEYSIYRKIREMSKKLISLVVKSDKKEKNNILN